jgi:small redox-active disulfide protein 2
MVEKRTITIYGSGCEKCQTSPKALERNAREAAAEMGIKAQFEYVNDVIELSIKGISATPALAIDGKVVSTGKVLEVAAIERLLAASKLPREHNC